jgi:LAO/AO transport system kinase
VSLVVLVPGLGDEVQALKAGIMEIADVFVVNKADREGVDRVVAEIQSMLSMASHAADPPAIVKTVAQSGEGTLELIAAIDAFRARAEESGALRRKQRAQLSQQFFDALRQRLFERVRARALPADEAERIVDRLAARETDPWSAAEAVLQKAGL